MGQGAVVDSILHERHFQARAMVCQAVLLAIPRDLEKNDIYLIEPLLPFL